MPAFIKIVVYRQATLYKACTLIGTEDRIEGVGFAALRNRRGQKFGWQDKTRAVGVGDASRFCAISSATHFIIRLARASNDWHNSAKIGAAASVGPYATGNRSYAMSLADVGVEYRMFEGKKMTPFAH
jgi:hypothetical protein